MCFKKSPAASCICADTRRDELSFMTSEAHLWTVYEDYEKLYYSVGPKQAKQAHFRDQLLRMRHLYGWECHCNMIKVNKKHYSSVVIDSGNYKILRSQERRYSIDIYKGNPTFFYLRMWLS